MPDYRTGFDSEYVGAWDLKGDTTVTISQVELGTEIPNGPRKSKKIVIHFSDAKKPMICNKTNAVTIASLYGKDTDAWIGKRITLWPTVTQMGNETKDCIRVRPVAPQGRADD